MPDTAPHVLLPLRSFSAGKTRLRDAMPAERRHELIRSWAEGVRKAAGDLPVVVMTSDPEVTEWALARDARVVRDGGWDLNSSVKAAVADLARWGVPRVVIAHGDLPLADDLTWLRHLEGVVVVPDRRADGTNVLAVPTDAGFRFSYGLASSHHHDGEALRLGLLVTVVRDPLLGWDVDVPEDLEIPSGAELEALSDSAARVRGRLVPGAAASP